MVSENILLALSKPSDQRTNADIEAIASFCRLFDALKDIPEHLFYSFCRIICIEEFEAGSIIYSEGDIGSDWYIIIEGSVSMVSNASSANPIRSIHKIGSQFGKSALEQDVARGETVTCLDHVYVLRVNRKPYEEMQASAAAGVGGEGQAFANEFLRCLCTVKGVNIVTSISRIVFQTNSVIVRQNEEPNGVYFILKGSASVVREVEFKDKVTRLIEIDELFGGSIFGIRSLCLNSVANVSIIAKCELIALFIPKSDFLRKVDVERQRQSLPPDYPDDASIRALFRKQMRWEDYKKKVVREVLKHKKAKRDLKLQY